MGALGRADGRLKNGVNGSAPMVRHAHHEGLTLRLSDMNSVANGHQGEASFTRGTPRDEAAQGVHATGAWPIW